MTCWNCGKEVPDGQLFCGSCGADLRAHRDDPFRGWQPPQASEPPGSNRDVPPQPGQYGGPSGGDLGILLKIFGYLCAVLYAVGAVRGLLGLVSILEMFRYYSYVGSVLAAVRGVANLAMDVFLCWVSVMIARRRTRENADGLFLCFAGGAVVKAGVAVLFSLLSLVLRPFYGMGFSPSALLLPPVLAALAVGVLLGLSVLLGETPLAGKSREEWMDSLRSVTDAARHTASEAGAAAYSAASAYSATTGYGPGRLKTDRSLLLYIILSIVTCGIYSLYFVYALARDVNTVCEGDGQRTSGLAVYIVLSILTCGIYALYWNYSVGNRLAANAPRYGMAFQENGTTVLLWELVGLLLCGLGPYFALYIIIKNTNSLCLAYNQYNNL